MKKLISIFIVIIVFFIMIINVAAKDMSIIYGEEQIAGTGWGVVTDTTAGISGNGKTLIISENENYSIKINTYNDQDWEIEASGNILDSIEFIIYYQYGTTDVYLKSVTISGEGQTVLSIVPGITGSGKDSMNEVRFKINDPEPICDPTNPDSECYQEPICDITNPDGDCYQIPDPICGTDEELIDGTCIKIDPGCTQNCEPDPDPLECPVNEEEIDGVCVPVTPVCTENCNPKPKDPTPISSVYTGIDEDNNKNYELMASIGLLGLSLVFIKRKKFLV